MCRALGRALSLLLFALLVTGCNGTGPRLHLVTGNVTFDGTPVQQGEIVFDPANRDQGADAGRIKDGVYAVKVKEGPHTVRIFAQKNVPAPAGQRGASGELIQEVSVDYLPAAYNTESTLTVEVTGPSARDFALKSRPDTTRPAR